MIKTENGEGAPVICRVGQLGLVSFPDAMEFEHRLLKLRFEEKISDTLLIFEHPPTITLGKFGSKESVLLPPEGLERRGIAYYDSDRGGDATFNCPGQLVVHPVVNLRMRGARAYIGQLEDMSLRVLAGYGIAGERGDHPGIWVAGRQMVAIGLRYSHGVSMHGLSLNVNPDLEAFKVINLCGLPGRTATSIERELGRAVSIAEANQRIQDAFSEVFSVKLVPVSREELASECFEEDNPS